MRKHKAEREGGELHGFVIGAVIAVGQMPDQFLRWVWGRMGGQQEIVIPSPDEELDNGLSHLALI